MRLCKLPTCRVSVLAWAMVAGVVVGSMGRGDDARLVEPPVAGDPPAIGFDGLVDQLKLFHAPGRQFPAAPLIGDLPGRLDAADVFLPNEVEQIRQLRAPPAVPMAPIRVQAVPAVEAQAFQRRVIVLRNVRGGVFVTTGPRGRDAWISSILRTTQPETARENAEKRLDDWLDVLARAFKLSDEQRAKLWLAGQGDISRFLLDCEAVVGEALALEAKMTSDDDVSTVPLWERCAELRDQYAGGLHGEGSLFRKQWEQVCVESGIEGRPWEGAAGVPQPVDRQLNEPINVRVLIR